MIPATIDIIGRGYPYAQNLNSSDLDGTPVSYQFITSSASPDFGPNFSIPGLALSSLGTVSISAANTASLALGRWVYKVRVTDGTGATAERDVLVLAQNPLGNQPPMLNTIGEKTVPVNSPLSFPVSATDPNSGQLLTVRAQLLPLGASFPQASATSPGTVSSTFNWTPVDGQEGTYFVNFEVYDNAATILISSELVKITVTGENNPPVLSPIGHQSVVSGGTLFLTLSASDPDSSQSISFEAFNLPAGAVFNPGGGGNPAAASFTWTPSPAQYDSTFTGITFRARDNGFPNLTDDETITITVGAGNQAPLISPIAAQTVTAGQALQFMVNATDANLGQTILLEVGTGGLPAGASFPTASGPSSGTVSSAFTWTPTPDRVGNHTVRFRAEDNGVPILSSEFAVSIQVIPANLPPTDLALLTSSVLENKPIGVPVGLLSVADPDAGDTHTFTLASGTGDNDNAAFTIFGNELQAAAVFDYETKNSYMIRVRATDAGGLWVENNFVIQVLDVNEPPYLINPISLGGRYGEAFEATIPLDAFGDPDEGQTLAYTAAGLPPGITFDAASQTFSGIPTEAGSFSVTVTALDDGVPALQESATVHFLIKRASLSFVVGNTSRPYGDENAVTVTLVGIVNGDNISATYETEADATSPAGGAYPIGLVLLDPDERLVNYTYKAAIKEWLTIQPREINVAANPLSMVYGEVDPDLTVTADPLVNGDTFTGGLVRAPGEGVGTYTITQGTFTAGPNYLIHFSEADLTITPAPLIVTAADVSRAYGEENPSLTGTLAGVVGSDDITASFSTTATSTSSVGTYDIVPNLIDPDGRLENYALTSNDGTLTITPKGINVAANPQSKVYGDADPALTYTADALLADDSFSGALARAAGEDVGAYAINQGTLSAGANYVIAFTGADLEITPKGISVVANPQSKVYGASDPALTYTADELVAGDSFSGTLARAAGEVVGSYAISQGTLSAGANYVIAFTGADLEITPAALVVSVDNASRAYGEGNPAFTGSLTGVVGSDNITATYSSPATPLSPVGAYAIEPAVNDPDGKLGNYTMTVNNGALTINPALASVTANAKSKTFGEVNPALDAVVTGEVAGGDVIQYTLATSATQFSEVGSYPITVTLLANPNYTVSGSDSTLTVNPAALEVTIHNPVSGHLTPINTPIVLSGSFTPTGVAGDYSAFWTFSSATMTAYSEWATMDGTQVSDTFQFPEPGVYLIQLTVVDPSGVTVTADTVDNDLRAYVVIYDPEGGFVTGGGWIWSPPGAFHPELEAYAGVTGKASFGFVSRYQKGASIPTGNTEFQFQAGNLNFKSSVYEWLVVAGARAQYKGSGTINGAGEFGFMLTAIDGQVSGGGGQDRFRIKIWEKETGVKIYDNQAGADDNAVLLDSTTLGGGSIVVHTPSPAPGKKK